VAVGHARKSGGGKGSAPATLYHALLLHESVACSMYTPGLRSGSVFPCMACQQLCFWCLCAGFSKEKAETDAKAKAALTDIVKFHLLPPVPYLLTVWTTPFFEVRTLWLLAPE
jgi:hypothetical protein